MAPRSPAVGPVLFTVYVSPIGRLIESFSIEYCGYADDTQLYTALKGDMGPGLDKLSQCTIALQHWFWINSLLLNPDKSDAAFYGTRPGLTRVDPINSVTVAICAISISGRLKILGVTLDAISISDRLKILGVTLDAPSVYLTD